MASPVRLSATGLTVSAPVIAYRGSFVFPLDPDALWSALEQTDHFERWWGWLSEFRLDGEGLCDGAVLHGVVSPPVPYRMRVRVQLVTCRRPERVDAVVTGDLRGEGSLRLRPEGPGTVADVAWQVEMMQRPMRLASRVAHPLLQWGHDRVVEMTVSGFRRHLARAGPPPPPPGSGLR